MSTNDLLKTIVDNFENTDITAPVEIEKAVAGKESVEEVNYDDVRLSQTPEHVQQCESYEEETAETATELSIKSRKAQKRLMGELEGLQFTNPGGKTSKMLPDSLDIIDRNRTRRAAAITPLVEVSKQTLKDEPLHHDKTGKLTCTVKGDRRVYDLCDCLVVNCTGCHWPCKQCKSRKCLIGCRQGRKDIIGRVEEMYTVTGKEERQIVLNPRFLFPIKH